MSVEAIAWALELKVGRSSAKFVLVAMANCANSDMTCWPSIQYLSDATCQDRKTVLENIKRLKEIGLIIDTNMRKGSTGQVIVYQLCASFWGLNSTENGSIEESQKRNHTESGTVPKTDGNSTVFPYKESQKRMVTVPKTGHGTVKNHKRTVRNRNNETPPDFVLPDWIPVDAWNSFLAMRKAIKKPVFVDGLPIAVKKLEALRLAGNDPRAVLEQSTMNNYQGLFEVKGGSQQRNGQNSGRLGKAGEVTAANAQKWLEEQDATR